MTIATNISKTLMEITGEPRIEIAILELLKDAIEHRIEKINAEIKNLESKYGLSFEEFENKFNSEKIPDSHSYGVETDYLEWEGLMNRLSKYNSLLSTLI
jgi:hypothetical protein